MLSKSIFLSLRQIGIVFCMVLSCMNPDVTSFQGFEVRRLWKEKISKEKMKQCLLLFLCLICLSGFRVDAVPYDYTSSIECLTRPHKPQYGGGIIVNPELKDGLRGWTGFEIAKTEHRRFGGNDFVVALGRTRPHHSVSQKVYLQRDKLYTFSAWIQVSGGNAPVTAVFRTKSGQKHAGAIIAKSKCWSMLKGGLTVDESGPAELYFESNDTSVEIWVDSVSLQPFTREEWSSHQDRSIDKLRKENVRIKAVDKKGNPLPNATISIEQKKLRFPFGCAMNKYILTNKAYQSWFTRRFTVTAFEDELKWYSNEPTQGHEDYSSADSLFVFCKKNGIPVRGHNVLWDDPHYQPRWVYSLSSNHLLNAANKRINSLMKKFKGQVIHWDVVNENLHFSFFEDRIRENVSASFYQEAHGVDPATPLFLNDYNTIEDSRDPKTSPSKFIEKMKSIESSIGNIRLGIGLESHFQTPNIPYMRSAIDTLAATGSPIWLTEVDVQNSPNMQAKYLEQILREAHSHPKVQGILMWAAWKPQGCYRMCLTDGNFKNLATGDVVDKLLREWGGLQPSVGRTDANGFFEASLFHGDYEVEVSHPLAASGSPRTQRFELAPSAGVASQKTTLLLNVSV